MFEAEVEISAAAIDYFFNDFSFGTLSDNPLKEYKRNTHKNAEKAGGLTVTRSSKMGSALYRDKNGRTVSERQSFESVIENSPMFDKLLVEEVENDDRLLDIAISAATERKHFENLVKNLGRRVYVRNANFGALDKVYVTKSGVVKYPTIRTGQTLDSIEGGINYNELLGMGGRGQGF